MIKSVVVVVDFMMHLRPGTQTKIWCQIKESGGGGGGGRGGGGGEREKQQTDRQVLTGRVTEKQAER